MGFTMGAKANTDWNRKNQKVYQQTKKKKELVSKLFYVNNSFPVTMHYDKNFNCFSKLSGTYATSIQKQMNF